MVHALASHGGGVHAAVGDRRLFRIFVLLLSIPVCPKFVAAQAPSLFTAGSSFTASSHYVSTTVFPWFTSTTGQRSGPWAPLEGRSAWTGTVSFWKGQLQQIMAANIDVIQITMFPDVSWGGEGPWGPQRRNLFSALNLLRGEGYDVPKVVPFLDTAISKGIGWNPSTPPNTIINLNTTTGKDTYVELYTQFYREYFSRNADAHAADYIAQIDGRVVLDTWHVSSNLVRNAFAMSRADIQSRLVNSLGAEHALFANLPSNGIFMINTKGSSLGVSDESLPQFGGETQYYTSDTRSGRIAAKVTPGNWDENIRNPGMFVPRDGGIHYKNAWATGQSAKSSGLRHVNVESWNEYDEGTGIYAAQTGPPYIKPGSGNNHTDTWSTTNDPFEYIKTTAEGARQFNDVVDRDAKILWSNFPTTMHPGETRTVQIIVRNEGDLSWRGADKYRFGQHITRDPVDFSNVPSTIDDTSNEIPIYGGVFRGRPITFELSLTAPTSPGSFLTHWSMAQDSYGAFGEELAVTITVLPYLAGDADLDDDVDGNDLLSWQRQFGSMVTPYSGADGSGDGSVDETDFDLWQQNFGVTNAPSSQVTVPEPGSIGMIGAIVGILRLSSRRRARIKSSLPDKFNLQRYPIVLGR